MAQCKQLIHLGLGYNCMSTIQPLLPLRHTLVSLDLSSNCFCDFATMLLGVSYFKNLKHLYLFGNPFALIKDYRRRVLRAAPGVLMLDAIAVTEAERTAAAVPSTGDPVDTIAMSVMVETIYGLNVEADVPQPETPWLPVLATIPAYATAAAAALRQEKDLADAGNPSIPAVMKSTKITTYFIVFRLADDMVYRSVDMDGAFVAAADAAAAAEGAAPPAAAAAKVDPCSHYR
jgi:hypothetical protein